MKSDITRSTFRPGKHYASVRMQQGRVQLDADWNEQMDIMAHLDETETRDVIGPCGGPVDGAGFAVVTDPAMLPEQERLRLEAEGVVPLGPGDFILTAGRYYVDGLLCENEAAVAYSAQPDLPDPGPLPEGLFLLYLDVWRRHLTVVEDPEMREVALGGPDTSTRLQTVWQVKALQVPEGQMEAGCLSDVPAWNELTAGSTGRLSSRADQEAPGDEPCEVPAQAGYRRLENQLYRVEIHDSTESGAPTFKWSRDNGSVVFPVTGVAGNVVSVSNLGRDDQLGLRVGDRVEVVDDAYVLTGGAEPLLEVTDIDRATLKVTLSGAPAGGVGGDPALHPLLRRWDRRETNGTPGGTLALTEDSWLDLEDGVQVRFEPGGTYRTGDYWLIPARTATADVEWPEDGTGTPRPQPPHGVGHHYCRLGIVSSDGSQVTSVQDCRELFPAATDLLSLFYVSGDGQEAPGGQPVPQRLTVGVARGRWPVEGARVRFEVTEGSGQLDGGGQALDVETGANGLAEMGWTLDQSTTPQEVEANLLDAAGSPVHLPVRFSATLATGEAPRQPGIHIVGVFLLLGREERVPLPNDEEIPIQALADGAIVVECDRPLDKAAVSPPTCFLTVDLPSEMAQTRAGLRPAVYQPTVVASGVGLADDRAIGWSPTAEASVWLHESLAEVAKEVDGNRVLARFTVKGNFIWSREPPPVYLDGNAMRLRPGENEFNLVLPSGDGVPGGDFEMWFWLTPG